MKSDSVSYTGLDILDALQSATNYNALLKDLVVSNARGARRLLDFGAGIGTFSRLVRSEGFEVTCVEADECLASRLQNAGFETYTELNGIENESMDFVFSLNVFEHITDDSRAVAEVIKKMAPGGKLFIYVPAFDCLWTNLDSKVKHQRRYTKDTLGNLVSSGGLKLISIRYADSLGFVAALLFKLLGKDADKISSTSIRFYDRFVVPISRELDSFCHRLFGKNVWVVCQKASE